MGLNVVRYSSYHHLLHLRLGPLFTSFLAEWWMSFGVWRSCNKAEIQMRLGLTFPSRAHGKHGKLGFNFSKHMPQHMAHGTWQTRPRANTNLTFTNTYHSTWHMAAGHMAKRDLIFITTRHSTWQTEHIARHIVNTYSTFTNTNQGTWQTWQTWQTHIQLLQAWLFLTNIYSRTLLIKIEKWRLKRDNTIKERRNSFYVEKKK